MPRVYTWFLPSDKYTDKHVVAILINHTLGALPTVFPRTGRKMQHSKEIPHIAASDPLPKPGLRKTVISLLESHVITLPATFLNAPQLFFFVLASHKHCTQNQGDSQHPSMSNNSPKRLCWSHLMLCLLLPWRPPGNPQVS